MDELIPTRATLLKRLKNWRDQSSWQEFFDTYWKLIYRVARKSGLTDDEAQDVVQQTMVSVAQHMPKFQYDPALGSFKVWLLTMTRWRMLDQLRKRDAQRRLRYDAKAHFDTHTAPFTEKLDELWQTEWETNLLEVALATVKRKIDPLKFQIFDLYVKKEWPATEVAKAFAVTPSQVYLAKHRVTEMIREEVQRLERELNLT